MSRIGKKPVAIPEGVEVTMHANKVAVKGPKGTLEMTTHHDVKVAIEEKEVRVEPSSTSGKSAAIWGTTAKLIANMIEGVTKGFEKKLELNGVGFRMAIAGKKINLALGFSHPVEVTLPEGIEAKIENNVLSFAGIDKQRVGQFAAEVRGLKPVEPYKGKGFRYVGEHVIRKEGKKTSA
jgi:large subunit ribosomal protein L6